MKLLTRICVVGSQRNRLMRLFKCIPKRMLKQMLDRLLELTYIFIYYRHFDTNVEMKLST